MVLVLVVMVVLGEGRVVVGEVTLAEWPEVLAAIIVVILPDLRTFLGNVSRLFPFFLADTLLRRNTDAFLRRIRNFDHSVPVIQ